MSFLDELGRYLTESVTKYELKPTDFQSISGTSFQVKDVDDSEIATIKVFRNGETQPIDAVSDEYGFEDVSIDVVLNKEYFINLKKSVIDWTVEKLTNIGYIEDSIKIDNTPIKDYNLYSGNDDDSLEKWRKEAEDKVDGSGIKDIDLSKDSDKESDDKKNDDSEYIEFDDDEDKVPNNDNSKYIEFDDDDEDDDSVGKKKKDKKVETYD